MYVNRISFTRSDSPALIGELSTAPIQAVLGAWRTTGQICGREWPVIQEGSGYSTVALSPERESLEPDFNSSYAPAAIACSEAEGLQVACQILGEDAESSPACSCANPTAYSLFTNYLSLEHRIRRRSLVAALDRGY